MQKDLIYTADVALYFKVTPATVRSWVKYKNFPAIKVGGKWRYNWDTIKVWEKNCGKELPKVITSHYKDYSSASVALNVKQKFLDPIRTKKFDLIHGDCISTMHNMHSDCIDLLLTDPPYNLGIFMQKRATNLKRMRNNYFGAAGWDNLDFEKWVVSMDIFFEEASRVIKPGGSMVVFMSVIKVETLVNLAQKHGFYYKTTGIWHKLNPMPRNMNLHFINSTEAWVYFVNHAHTGTFNNDGKALHDFYETAIVSKSERAFGIHPTQKPIKLMNYFINTLSNSKNIVLDPFMGSGSTGVAAVELGRQFIGIEINEEYFKIAAERVKASN